MRFPKHIPVFGDPKFRGVCPKETADHITAVGMIKERHPDLFSIMIHPKNEGKRTGRQAMLERQAGSINKGASDFVFPCSPALVIELKRKDHTQSRWQEGQIEYLTNCQSLGAYACVALGWEAVIEAIEWFKANKLKP